MLTNNCLFFETIQVKQEGCPTQLTTSDLHVAGGTIAMYSLLCRHARINSFGQVEEEDAKTGTVASDDAQRCNSGSLLERSRPMQKALLGVVLVGNAFMMCDGVLSPAASGESAHHSD
jgi:KUP system potassium uptake protein